jgi:hypothetical protein
VSAGDGDLEIEGTLGRAAHAREVVPIMRLRDYDHDGRATEFFLQTGSAPCGKRLGVVLGLSRERPSLHAFGSARHPGKPLVLRVEHWEALSRSQGPIVGVDWTCGDHGSDTQDEVELRADGKEIHVTRRVYACSETWDRGALRSTEEE